MKTIFRTIIAGVCVAIVSAVVWMAMALYFPIPWLYSNTLGTAFTQITGSTLVSAYPTIQNENLALTPNLTTSNTYTGGGTQVFSGLTTAPYASSTLHSCSVCYFGGTATSSITNGVLSLVSALGVSSGGTGLSTFGGTNRVLYTTAADTLASEAAFTYNPSTDTLTSINISYSTSTGATTTLSGALSIASTTANMWRAFWVKGAAGSEECNLTDGATVTLDLSLCNQARVVLGGNRILDITNETQALGQTIRLVVCSDSSARSISSWDSAILWPSGTAPTQTATANKCDVFAGFVTMATSTPKIFLGSTLNF